ncbi:MAG TPA: serine hydrolase domain-containing protein [Bdellovibrionota bacterium]|jgi:CubicO group peptidase (beta-lactamase class C family)|nr:serine hydrolase domain-containing protein [Bdellovibrionota bacterium]
MDRLRTQTLEPARFVRTMRALDALVAEGAAPGAVMGLWEAREPGVCRLAAVGSRRIVPSAQPMEERTPFDLASLTKVLATALLTARSVERGLLSWDTPVQSVLPQFSSGSGIRIRHLLSHTSGQPAWKPFYETIRDRLGEGATGTRGLEKVSIARRQSLMRELVLAVEPEAKPGAKAVYSDLAFLTLGFVLEEIWKMPLDRAVEHGVWNPLGADLRFFRVDRGVEAGRRPEYAATEDCPWRGGVLQGQVHDDNCWSAGGYGGHAGAFGDAAAVLTVAAGLHEGAFLSHSALSRMWTRVDEPPGCERTYGWDTPSGDMPSCGRHFSPTATVGHLGFTGTSLWIDLRAGIAVTLLSNRVHPTRENERFKPWRPRVHDALREDLGY